MWFSIEYPTMDGGYPVLGCPPKRRPQRYTIPSGFLYENRRTSNLCESQSGDSLMIAN